MMARPRSKNLQRLNAMNSEDYQKITHWSLHSHLVEIQSRVESGRILAAAVRDGRTNDPKRDADSLAKSLADCADWIGYVQREHAPEKPQWTARPTVPGFYWCRGEHKS